MLWMDIHFKYTTRLEKGQMWMSKWVRGERVMEQRDGRMDEIEDTIRGTNEDDMSQLLWGRGLFTLQWSVLRLMAYIYRTWNESFSPNRHSAFPQTARHSSICYLSSWAFFPFVFYFLASLFQFWVNIPFCQFFHMYCCNREGHSQCVENSLVFIVHSCHSECCYICGIMCCLICCLILAWLYCLHPYVHKT